MASYYLCPLSAILQYFNNTGVVLSGGKVYTYTAGTTNPQTTYTDSTGATANANPIILDSSGRLPSVAIWQQGGVNLKLVFADSSGNPIGPTFDQVSGINDPTAFGAALSDAASGFGADLVANAVRSYDIFSSLRAANVPNLSAGQTLIVSVEGGSTPGDGLAGQFYWNASSSAADDGLNVIKPTAESGNGRYIRISSLYGSGTFTGTLSGMGSTTTGIVQYFITGKICMLLAAFTGTSNANSMTLTGIPAICNPQTESSFITCMLEDNGSNIGGWAQVTTGSQINFGTGFNNNQSGFTPSGTKGFPAGWMIKYSLG